MDARSYFDNANILLNVNTNNSGAIEVSFLFLNHSFYGNFMVWLVYKNIFLQYIFYNSKISTKTH